MSTDGRMSVNDFSSIDRVFGNFIVRRSMTKHSMDAEMRETLLATAMIVSAERSHGNSCVNLSDYSGVELDLGNRIVKLPDRSRWSAVLDQSGVCHAISHRDDNAGFPAYLVLEGDRLYLSRYHAAEDNLAKLISGRVGNASDDGLESSAGLFRRLFKSADGGVASGAGGDGADQAGSRDSGEAGEVDWQAVAGVAALRSPLVFITGGPGTGKTTVVARLLALLLDRNPEFRIAVAAPTGRAAARLSESIAEVARREGIMAADGSCLAPRGQTLHRLLGYNPATQRFRYNASRRLSENVVVVDEASMIDVLMMSALLESLGESARLIVLGDPDQLASVDAGFVLADVASAARMVSRGSRAHDRVDNENSRNSCHSEALIRSFRSLAGATAASPGWSTESAPLADCVIHLRKSWRFGSKSGIGRLAAATRESDTEAALGVLESSEWPDAQLTGGPLKAGNLLAPLEEMIADFLGATTPMEALRVLGTFRILAGLREGQTGVSGLNSLVERWLHQRGLETDGWYDHRPLLVTSNDSATGLFNGDVGVVLNNGRTPMVHFMGSGGGIKTLSPSQLPAHETAWAITVHKSQGSEYDHVLFVLPERDNRTLSRELIYTAVTRARKSVVVHGDRELLRLGIGRTAARSSGLVAKLLR